MASNVYEKIMRDGFVCDGNSHYTEKEMRAMLLNSNLSPEEMEMVYSHNYNEAMNTLEVLRKKMTLYGAGNKYFPDELKTEMDLSFHARVLWKALVGAQMISIIVTLVMAAAGLLSWKCFGVSALIIALTWAAALIFMLFYIGADEDTPLSAHIEEYYNKEVNDLLSQAKRDSLTIENTNLMYWVLKSEINHPHLPFDGRDEDYDYADYEDDGK